MSFYDRLQATANRLLKGKGQSITLTKITAGTYNPATGGFTGAGTSTQTAYGAIFDYGNKNIDGTLIKQGDKQLLLSAFKTDGTALTAPVLGDTVSIGGVTYTLVEPLKEVNPAGTVVLFDVNLRCG
jgi:hypothetical protein